MVMNIVEDKKLLEIWLTNSEQQDENIKKFIREKSAEYQKLKYTVAIFLSGQRNLFECTDGLIKNNLCL